MVDFTVLDRSQARLANDFVIDATPSDGLTEDETAYVENADRLLDQLANDETTDGSNRWRASLLAARTAWRANKAGELRIVANDFAAKTLDAKAALARNTAIASDINQSKPDVVMLPAKPPARFAGDFSVVASGVVLDAADQSYLACQKSLIDKFAADEAADIDAKYPEAGLAFRRKQRAAAIDRLNDNFKYWKSGTPAETAFANVAFVNGEYSAKRERLRESLFTVRPIRGKGSDSDFNIEMDIRVARDLPPPDDVPTQAQQDLFVEINKADTVIGTVCRQVRTRDDKRGLRLQGEYIDKLVGIARLGLEGPQPELAKLALASLCDEFIAREAGEILNRYVARLGQWAIGFAFGFLIVYVFVRTNACAHAGHCDSWWDAHKSFLLAAAGASIGTWASFSVRNVNLTFEQLAAPEEELLDAPLRIVFVVTLTMAVCLLFWTNAINVKIGDLNTEAASFTRAGTVAILIGFFCGLSERALASAIAGRASAFVGGIAGGK